jgi:addiction module RelE/StbE family toxin
MYRLEYLPLAKQDMVEIAKYISHVICNPTAAQNLALEMTGAAEKLVDFPYINPVHRSMRPLDKEYRKLIVKNYIMFYWVDEVQKKIVIARVIYSRRDYEKLL